MTARGQRRTRARRSVAALALFAILAAGAGAGCSGATQRTATPTPVGGSVPTESVPTTAPATSAPAPAVRPAELSRLRIRLRPRWSGFSAPVDLKTANDGTGRLFVVEQKGRIRVIRDGKVQSGNFLDISDKVTFGGEQGLLGLAFAPDYATNGHFYVDYVDASGDTIIARGVAGDPSSDKPMLSSFETILRIDQPPYPNHKGGGLAFGPDGYLYVGMGDGGSRGDPGNRAQNPRVLLGKLLRIDAEGDTGSKKYAIPEGQPIRSGWAPEVYAIGLRNPWRFSFDTSTADLWIGDVGQDAWEEIDFAPAGAGPKNWGWNFWEGNHPYPPGSSPSKSGVTFPIAEYPHPKGESITGGYVYRGMQYPALVGTYVYADFVKGWLGALRNTTPDGQPLASAKSRTMLTDIGQPSSFGVDEAGELYLIDYGGSIYQVTATEK